jgi:Do/DeqQ family serine protease
MGMAPNQVGTLVLAAGLGSAITLGINGLWPKSPETVFRVEHSNALPSAQARYAQDGAPADFTAAAEQVTPSVVHIKSTSLRPSSGSEMFELPEAFRDFFERRSPEGPRPSVGAGSGVILSADGYILTNNHVIENADDLEISLYDNRTFKAELVGSDPSTDLALLKVEAEGLTPISLGNSDEVKVGQWVLAVGNPFNLNSTITAGIVSAKARNINILRERSAIESFIQTDAAVNPGNSGGALVDLGGNLIGINTAIASPTGSYSGYSFAVPVNLARKVVEDLIQYGTVQRGFLGITIRNLDGNLAREKSLPITEGVYVDSVAAGGAAQDAGIRSGDVILSVDGKPTRTSSELQAIVGSHRPGDQVALTLLRDGKNRDLSVTLKNRQGNTSLVSKSQQQQNALDALGAEFESLSDSEARRLDVAGGVRVKALGSGKLRASTDIREGFIILRAAGKPVRSVEELEKALAGESGGVMLEGMYEGYPGKYYYAFGL